MNAPALPDDATLVAWLDDELPREQAAAVAAAVRADTAIAARVALLRAAHAELAWAFAAPDVAPPGARSAPRGGRWRQLVPLVLAAAALAVVVVIATGERPADGPAAQNAWLEARLVARQPAWPLFSGIHFELRGKARTDTPCRIVARNQHETEEQLADRAFADADQRTAIPLLLEAEITGPDGFPRLGRVARVAGTFGAAESGLAVELVDCVQPTGGISPIVTVALEPSGPREDFWWGLRRVGEVRIGGDHGCVPLLPGAYRVRFVLRGVTRPGDSRWPAFGEPLSLATGFQVDGVVGEWSAPVDGMRARIVANTARPTRALPLVVALQLRNESDRPRHCNVTGTTIAKIPQPFHFDLLVDGEQWQQRERLGVITDAMSLGLLQTIGSERSILVLADYWRRNGEPPSALRGAHRVGIRFHSEASLWLDTDKELWQGKIDTPTIDVDFGRD